MSISVKILESDRQIQTMIHGAIADEVNKRVKKRASIVRDRIKQMIPKWISSQPEMQSISTGGVNSLAAQFGIRPANADGIVKGIYTAVSNAIIVDLKPVDRRTLKGGVEFSIQPANFNNLLSLELGFTNTAKGQRLHWMDWLLLRGSEMIVLGYTYEPSSGGISGGGTMTGGGSWRVPPQYSGTPDNNFITRALSGRQKEIQTAVRELFK